MTRRRPGARAALAAAIALLLAGCTVNMAGSEIVACAEGDEGTPSNGVILMSQSVPSATFVPCLEGLPLGWRVAGLDVRDRSARFWMDSDRFGAHAIEVKLTATCDTEGSTEIRSDRQDMRRLEHIRQVTPEFLGRRYYVFDGGCITVLFALSGTNSSEALAVVTQGLGAVTRDELRDLVWEESDGRLELDPPAAAEGGR